MEEFGVGHEKPQVQTEFLAGYTSKCFNRNTLSTEKLQKENKGYPSVIQCNNFDYDSEIMSCLYDPKINCYIIPVHTIGNNRNYLTGSEASMFLELPISSYQYYNTFNDCDDVYYGKLSTDRFNCNNDQGYQTKYPKQICKELKGAEGFQFTKQSVAPNKQTGSNSNLASTSTTKEYRSMDSNSVIFHSQESSEGKYARNFGIDNKYKALFEAQVKRVNNLENELCVQNETIQRLEKAPDCELGENRNLSLRVVQLQKNLEELTPNLSKKDKHDQCDIRLDASPEKDQQTKELTEKLTIVMSNKLASDEEHPANVNIRNQPMNLAMEYELICSNEWLHVKNTFDSSYPNIVEGVKVDFLCSAFIIAEKQALDYFKELKYRVKDYLDNPFNASNEESSRLANLRPVDSWLSLPKDLDNGIGNYLSNIADKTDLSELFKSVKQAMRTRFPYNDLSSIVHDHQMFGIFLESCVKLAWKMALQSPPVIFSMDGVNKKWDMSGPLQRSDLYWGSVIPKDRKPVIDYYVYPMLYQGERLLVKGKVLVS